MILCQILESGNHPLCIHSVVYLVTLPFRTDLLLVSNLIFLPGRTQWLGWCWPSSAAHTCSLSTATGFLSFTSALAAGERLPQVSSHCAQQFSCYRLSWPSKSCETLFIAHLPNYHTVLHSQLVWVLSICFENCQHPKYRGTRTICLPTTASVGPTLLLICRIHPTTHARCQSCVCTLGLPKRYAFVNL